MIAIGIENPKHMENVGSLLRSAYIFGADVVFTIGGAYKPQATDTTKCHKHIPVRNFDNLNQVMYGLGDELIRSLLVGIECEGSIPTSKWRRTIRLPEWEVRSSELSIIYLLGNESHGLSEDALSDCDRFVTIPSPRPISLNVAVAGSMVLAQHYWNCLLGYEVK